jgi:hypothetical protein
MGTFCLERLSVCDYPHDAPQRMAGIRRVFGDFFVTASEVGLGAISGSHVDGLHRTRPVYLNKRIFYFSSARKYEVHFSCHRGIGRANPATAFSPGRQYCKWTLQTASRA